MENRGLGVFDSFEGYVRARKPVLDEAFGRALTEALEGVATRAGSSLMESLLAGKKLRGCLTCLVCDALGGGYEAAVPRAVAIEMIQAATLIHDDFVDQDAVRRGRPAVWTLEGPRRAVLMGDVVFASAIRMMSELSGDDGRAVSFAIAEVSRGALHEPLDPASLAADITSHGANGQMYKKIIGLKTGILFGAATLLGAIAAGAGDPVREKSFQYGLRLGEAYQVADDLEEVVHLLKTGSILPREMVGLAPALLHFVPEAKGEVAGLLRGEYRKLKAFHREIFKRAADLMEDEIGRLAGHAASRAEALFLGNGFAPLAREAPEAIIMMCRGPAGPSSQ